MSNSVLSTIYVVCCLQYNMCYLPHHMNFQVLILLLTSNFISLWLEKILSMISDSLNLLGLLWPNIWSDISLSGKIFISPSFLRDCFAGYRILIWKMFSFFLLALEIYYPTVFWSAGFYWETHWQSCGSFFVHAKFLFSSCLKIFLFYFWQFDDNVSWCGILWVHFSWVWMSISFLRFGKVFGHHFFK